MTEQKHGHERVDVAIVGAGPVGLFLAVDLIQRGISVHIIDKAPAPIQHSRSSVVWPRQLELFDSIRVADAVMDRGRAVEGVAFHSRGRTLGELRFASLHDTPFPFGIAVSQKVTECVLIDRLEALHGPLSRQKELVGLAQDRDGVDLTVRTESGDHSVRAKWVVGADGAHSTVRTLCEIGFRGPEGTARFAVCDAGVEGSLPMRMAHYFYTADMAIGLAPVTDSAMRIAVSLPSGVEKLEPDFFRTALMRSTAHVTDVQTPEWSAAFDVRFRIADVFRQGRVLLAGDAARAMSPAGGQGMNTGLQDAANLAWKLASVIGGAARDSLLDSYDTERRTPSTSATSRRFAGWSAARGQLQQARRDAQIYIATRGRKRPSFSDVITQLDTRYVPPSIAGRRSHVGRRFPSLAGTAPRRAPLSSWPTHEREGYTLFVWPGATDSQRWKARVDQLRQLTVHTVHDLGPSAPPVPVLGLGRRAHYFLVRPDGHIAAEGSLGEPKSLPNQVLRGDGTERLPETAVGSK